MPKKNVLERRRVPLPPLPEGSESSLRVVDVVYDDGSVKRLWAKDDGVQVLGFTEDGKVIAIIEKGYTHLVGGYIEPGEDPVVAARRELLEETGYEAGPLEFIAAIKQDSGGSERAIWLYIARDCSVVRNGEADIGVTLMSPFEFWKLITSYIFTDPGTKRNGLMSLALAALAFQKLGMYDFVRNQDKKQEQKGGKR